MRSGTENVVGVIGFAKAMELASEHRKYESDRFMGSYAEMQVALTKAFPSAVISLT